MNVDALVLALAVATSATITVDHNAGAAATPAFRFARVPPPSKSDAASSATVTVIAGTINRGSGDVRALVDGLLPSTEDDPGANLFFQANTWGGRIRFDFGRAIDIAQINSYSWHADTRAPQLYYVYGSDGTSPSFDPAPGTKRDLAACGWTQIAFVDTRPKAGDRGGQYGVSITAPSGSIGRYRYLLFDVFETESDDVWGNTFYSEIDVVAKELTAASPRSSR